MRLTVTFATAPVTATARLAPTLYNKARVLNFEEDDSPQTIFTEVYPLFHGGVARNGELCPGLRYTDGCNNSRPYVGAVAINGHNTYNNTVWLDPGPNHDAGKLVWSQAQQLLDHGWDIENHSDWHTEFVPLPAQQLASLDELIASRLKGYRPSVHIVPTNYAGYPTAAFNAGYVAVSSASQGDNLPMFNAWDEKRVALSALPVSPTPFVFRRYSADASNGESAQTLLTRLKAVSDALMAPGNPASEVYVQRVFAHAINFNVLRDWMNYTQSIAGDKLWVTTLREMEEYRRVRKEVVKQEALSGNTLTVDLDYSAVGANIRFQNLTLLVDSPGTITDIKVTGADSSSYNVATKQVNIFHTYRRDIVPLPVQLSAFTARRAGAGVQLNWHTATELNSREFEVQRSANGVNFSVTGTVPAAGTTSMPRSYSFLDASVPANTSMYYRLRQVDTDGASHYSPVVQVAAVAPQGMRLWVAPNPATVSDGLTVTVVGGEGQVLRVQLLDALGRTVRSEVLRPTNGQQDLHLSLPESTKDGVYILRVVGAQQLLQTRVLLTR
ncbi:T9SS type A sorting domain-containing protein [Hymenobacter arizonensis]|uniref:Por secretion system C-terminal sorting domain-containing protein n=1 Tax=Hymenobacter arizonensis TaxID=1227077 RepID=A0A1I5STJ1_HYMAR|nr:T9SS type A sorting domain-containing protein [Hymenobacter arizonensis]SFP73586.1 Por secretion system C-terminal sorting domain-containing protein [Hymenobacter arizonensis]